jgi:hypothetical protein
VRNRRDRRRLRGALTMLRGERHPRKLPGPLVPAELAFCVDLVVFTGAADFCPMPCRREPRPGTKVDSTPGCPLDGQQSAEVLVAGSRGLAADSTLRAARLPPSPREDPVSHAIGGDPPCCPRPSSGPQRGFGPAEDAKPLFPPSSGPERKKCPATATTSALWPRSSLRPLGTQWPCCWYRIWSRGAGMVGPGANRRSRALRRQAGRSPPPWPETEVRPL